MKFNIIIPFYKNYDTIEDLLLSIKDQDHIDKEVTIIVDGEDTQAGEQLTGYLDEGKFSFNLEMLKENKGASFARNYGAKISNSGEDNDILFFVDADCKLMPGILYDFNNILEHQDDISFVYGNHRYEIDKPAFISQEYDPYLLETMNYIPTMSPIRRSAFNKVGGFDNRDYFQDWGIFYKLSKEGFKGKYLGDKYYVFSTKSPTEESISGEKGLTLDQKCKEFRDFYGISDKKIVTSTWGAPLQAIQRAKMLNSDYAGASNGSTRMTFPSNYKFSNWEATYMVGCYNSSIQALENHMTSVVGRPIYHFIGTDVFTMYNVHSTSALKDIQKMFESQNAIVLSNSSRCQKELKDCGIESELVFTPIYNIDQYKILRPLPKDFTVGIYTSDTNMAHKINDQSGYSNIPLLLDVAKSMPDIKFKLFGIENMYETVENIEYCGRIPESHMVEFINDCSMVLRSTIHDGFPQLPIQYLMCGRQALVSCPDEELKFVDRLTFEDNLDWEKNKDEVISNLYKCRDKSKFVNIERDREEAFNYYNSLMSVDKFKDKIYNLIK